MLIWIQHANWWLLYQIRQGNLLYRYSTQAINLDNMLHCIYRQSRHAVPCPFQWNTLVAQNIWVGLVVNVQLIYPITGLSLWLRKLASLLVFTRRLQRGSLLVEVDLRHRSHRSGTSSTNLMPICLHLDCSSSPLVSTKELREWDLHTTKFRRTH